MEWSLKKYELFIYDIVNQYSLIEKSDLVVKQKDKFWAEVTGKIYFKSYITLEVREIVDFTVENFIRRYSITSEIFVFCAKVFSNPDHLTLTSKRLRRRLRRSKV